LRKILAFNLIGTGAFVLCAVIARRGAAAGMGGDPVPQALLITAIVVAFSASALAVALVLRLFDATGSATLTDVAPEHDDT
jgi:multicomponent Na+:H+ antiporter subunit C